MSGCRARVYQQAQLSDTTKTLTFFSERETVEGVQRLLLTGSNGDKLAYLANSHSILPVSPISWSLDGSSFVATGFDKPSGETCLLLYKSVDNHQCLPGAAVWAPRWSPDGNWIASSDEELSKRKLELYDVHTGQVTLLTNLPDNRIASSSTWSPDTTLI
jgi:Tol biopolymer transport system component